MSVTMLDIARRAHVSRPVVSAVLGGKNTCRVSAEKRQLILDLVDEMGYQRNQQASCLRAGRKAETGVFLPCWDSVLVLQLVRSMTQRAQDLLLPLQFDFGMQLDSYVRFVSEMADSRHPAIISYVPMYSSKDELELSSHLSGFMESGGYVVSLNSLHWDMPQSSFVRIDEEGSGVLAAGYLRDCGCQAFVALSREMRIMTERYAGYAKALDHRCHLISFARERYESEFDHFVLEDFPSLPRRVGIYSLHSNYSFLVTRMSAHGWTLGSDYHLVSYDYECELGEHAPVGNIVQPFEEMGRLAIEQVYDHLEGRKVQNRVLPSRLEAVR